MQQKSEIGQKEAMEACGSLQQFFDPENPISFIDSLSSSWNSKSDHSFTEIFSERHINENPNSKSDTRSPIPPQIDNHGDDFQSMPIESYHKRSESMMSSESLQICTEGLGFESWNEIDDMKIESLNVKNSNREGTCRLREKVSARDREFPPPISSIGRTGKPWVCFESCREDGRLLLKEVRIPSLEILRASREDGRLRLCFVQSSDHDDDDSDGDEGEEEESECNEREEFERGDS